MTTSEAWFPPRCVTNRKKRDVQLPGIFVDDFTDHTMRFRSEPCVAGKETRFIAGIHQIHVGSTPPAIDGVTAPLMLSLRCVNDNIANRNLTICWKRSGLRVPQPYKPRCEGRRGKNRYMASKEVERPKREMVCVRVSYEDRIERR